MSFTGDLTHIAIVDVIQLLHSTRKSGTLCVKRGKRECRIVFHDGYMVSAMHPKNNVQIGNILVELGVIGQDVVDSMIEEQSSAGDERKPLVSMLIDSGKIKSGDGLKGLEKLIQMTVVELISWQKGTFHLDVESTEVQEQYRYVSDKAQQEITLDSQMVLMDALRIFDELMRDGKIEDDDSLDEEVEGGEAGEGLGVELSVDMLGLSGVDELEKEVPSFYSGLEAFDPAEIHRQQVEELLPDLPEEGQKAIASFIAKKSSSLEDTDIEKSTDSMAVIMHSADDLVRYLAMNIFKDEASVVMTTNGEKDLDGKLKQCISKGLVPVIVFDVPGEGEEFSREKIAAMQQKILDAGSQALVIQFADPEDYKFAIDCLGTGVRAVFPKPSAVSDGGAFAEDTINFFTNFRSYLQRMISIRQSEGAGIIVKQKDAILKLAGLADASSVFTAILEIISSEFSRVITFSVRDELIGVRGVGIGEGKDSGIKPVANLKLPIKGSSLLSRVIDSGEVFFGESSDSALKKSLFEAIGAPSSESMLFLPLKIQGKVKTLIYADFGQDQVSPVSCEHLEILASHAGLVLENDLYRKHFKKSS